MVYTIRLTDLLHARETFPEQRKVKFFWSRENLETLQCAEDQWVSTQRPLGDSAEHQTTLEVEFESGGGGNVPLPERLSSSSHRVFLPPALDQRALCLLVYDLGSRASL